MGWLEFLALILVILILCLTGLIGWAMYLRYTHGGDEHETPGNRVP